MNEKLTQNQRMPYALSKEKIINRIMQNGKEVCCYRKEVLSDVIDLYTKELVKALMDGEKINITGIGTITPKVRQHYGKCHLPNRKNPYGDHMPYIRLYFVQNNRFREKINKKFLRNLKETHKPELSKGKPPLKYQEVDWGKVDPEVFALMKIEGDD